MRSDISFKTLDGTSLSAWLYRPEGPKPHPIIIMSFGFSGLKEMGLDAFASRFEAAGMAVLVYDHRGFGDSAGEPKREIDPWAQCADMRDAITFAQGIEGIDRDRIGLWGTSYAGGHTIYVSAVDRRVKCAVAQVPFISGFATTTRLIPTYHIERWRDALHLDRKARAEGAPPAYAPVAVDPEDQVRGEPYKYGLVDSREPGMAWLSQAGQKAGYHNDVTLRSYDLLAGYEPGFWVERVAPTPLLMIVGDRDEVCVTDVQLDAFERARGPKKLELVSDCGHYDVYWRKLDQAAQAAASWFGLHLRERQASDAERAA